jgi:hypothetical protein
MLMKQQSTNLYSGVTGSNLGQITGYSGSKVTVFFFYLPG